MKVAITGGLGFVGTAVSKRVLDLDGVRKVIAIGRNPSPKSSLVPEGMEYVSCDLSQRKTSFDWLREVDTVFHIAAKAGIRGSFGEYQAANFEATKHLLAASEASGVKRFIFTSTPSVVFSNSDVRGGSESMPYLTRRVSPYAFTKAMAEKLVLGAHKPGIFQTLAIRPHLVWGENDPHLLPKIIVRHRQKRLRIVGHGTNKMDLTHIDNVAHAHLCALESMLKNQTLGGKAYFIAQDEPVELWPWLNHIFQELGMPPLSQTISFPKAYFLGFVLEKAWSALRLSTDPPMTRFVASQLAHDHWFSTRSANVDLGYRPIIDMEQAMKKSLPWLRQL